MNRYQGIAGKYIGGKVYVGADYAPHVVPVLATAREILDAAAPSHRFNVVVWDKNKHQVRFVDCPEFDQLVCEPEVGASVTVDLKKQDVSLRQLYRQVWHRKELFVGADYRGFDVAAAAAWTKSWSSRLSSPADGSSRVNWHRQLIREGIVRPDLWQYTPEQEIKSTITSVNHWRLPAFVRAVPWVPGSRNADIGSGAFGNVTDHLRSLGVENLTFDPFALPEEHNRQTASMIRDGQCDTVTVSNCLNVIKEQAARLTVIQRAHNALKDGGSAFMVFHEGDRSGIGRVSQQSKEGAPLAWQENRISKDYVQEIGMVFSTVKVKGNMIIASK